MRKGRDRENEKKKKENNDENSSPLSSLPVDRLTVTDCNAGCTDRDLDLLTTAVLHVAMVKLNYLFWIAHN